jgi:hypothetical protein
MRKLVVVCLAVGLAGASNFYIFYKQVGSSPNCPALSVDATNNAPAHRMWTMDSAGTFTEDTTIGDWMIRAVLDWTPQDTNASTVWFVSNMPRDTVPNINFPIRAMIKNMGKDTLPIGTPVRLSITGPQSYAYEDTVTTTTKLRHGATALMTFAPPWHVPSLAGVFHVEVWTEAAGEQWPADDTIAYDLNVDWIQYHTDAQMHWLTWATPERAVKFNPDDFCVPYPVGITSVKADFYLHSTYPWDDSSFTFKIYANDGQTLLYQSETLEAVPGTPGPYRYCELDSTIVIDSGSFYVAVRPVSSNGYPSSSGDSSVGGHSYYGGPGYWYLWDPDTSQSVGGDLFISARVKGRVGPASSEKWIEPNEKRQSAASARPGAAWGGICTARTEPQTGLSGDAPYAVLEPEPWVLPSPPILLPGTIDTLKYDNGTPIRAWCESVPGDGRGVKFISPAESVTLAGALVHIYSGWPSPGDTWASFRVYADDGIDGAPGTELYSLDSVNIKRGAWNYIQLAPVSVREGSEPEFFRPSLRIENYPNPVSDRVILRWQVPRGTPVAVNLYDATGRLLRSLYAAHDRATAGTLAVDTRTLAAGIYLVRLETAEGSVTRKVVVDR